MTSAKERLHGVTDKAREVAATPEVAESTQALKETARRTKTNFAQGGLKLGAALAGTYVILRLAIKIIGGAARGLRRK
jgi:hypothetical protein